MNISDAKRVILIDPDDDKRRVLSSRLKAQGYAVEAVAGPAEAATMTLAAPPGALIADLWMPSISGVQLCRLLRSEPATIHVPIILRAAGNAPRNRFWAERAGAAAYVPKGRIGELVRALSRAMADAPTEQAFFTELEHDVDIRDRIARQLDEALYDSVLAAEVRALGNCESFARLFDLFSQFVCQVTSYRWLALCLPDAKRFAIHCHPRNREHAESAARAAVSAADLPLFALEDEDASETGSNSKVLLRDVAFGSVVLGRVAMEPVQTQSDHNHLLSLMAKELGGPIRMALLVEESQRLARYDSLTGIMNRRAFVDELATLLQSSLVHSSGSLGLILIDIDHFKAINDGQGHAAGDLVLTHLGGLLEDFASSLDRVARWGGEEFVFAMGQVDDALAEQRAEQLRKRIENLVVTTPEGTRIPITASLGVAVLKSRERLDDLVERADKAMYQAKVSGRNRVVVASDEDMLVAQLRNSKLAAGS